MQWKPCLTVDLSWFVLIGHFLLGQILIFDFCVQDFTDWIFEDNNMPRYPPIAKFEGDNETSFLRWSMQFEAQLRAFVKQENNSWRDLLLIYTEDDVFSVASKAIADNNDITYEE